MTSGEKKTGGGADEKVEMEVLSTVAHDMRTPLGTVRQAIEILLEGIDGQLSEKQKGRLEVALRNVARLEDITSEIKQRALKYKEV